MNADETIKVLRHTGLDAQSNAVEPEMTYGCLMIDAAALIEQQHGELAALREATRWIPMGERLPTVEDADENGQVLGYEEPNKFKSATSWKAIGHPTMKRFHFTHWMPLPAAPAIEAPEKGASHDAE